MSWAISGENLYPAFNKPSYKQGNPVSRMVGTPAPPKTTAYKYSDYNWSVTLGVPPHTSSNRDPLFDNLFL